MSQLLPTLHKLALATYPRIREVLCAKSLPFGCLTYPLRSIYAFVCILLLLNSKVRVAQVFATLSLKRRNDVSRCLVNENIKAQIALKVNETPSQFSYFLLQPGVASQ